MNKHSLFYFPYSSFTNRQLPLLKVAALYFDRLCILDPVGASWGTIGADHFARDALELLRSASILELIPPADALSRFIDPLIDAIRRDMADRDFLALCEAHAQATGKRRWTLSLAKVPMQIQTDQAMRHLLGEFARDVARDSGQLRERTGKRLGDYHEFAESGQLLDEYREGYGAAVEYRYADFPLALGEAIMLNHALFTGLLHAGAVPVTDEPFHSQLLAHKLNRITLEPAIRDAITSRAEQRRFKAGALAAAALMDTEIELPILHHSVPLAEVLEYRQKNMCALGKVRETLGLLARRIEAEPWSTDFAREIETKTLPDLMIQLADVKKARSAWLQSATIKRRLKAASAIFGGASAVLTLVTTPIAPIALASAGLAVVSGGAIPGVEWLMDFLEGKKTEQENGLHYLLRM